MTSLAELEACGRSRSFGELGALYAQEGPVLAPTGLWRGTYLGMLDTPGARDPFFRVVCYLGWELSPFGIDFDTNLWFFVHPKLQVGRFETVVGKSRWRDTETVRLHYETSRLPALVRNVLYDEVKPLSENLCLGLGGVNAGRGQGDRFLFALSR